MRSNIETLRLIAYHKADRLKRQLIETSWIATNTPPFTIPESHRVGYLANLDELFETKEKEFWESQI